MYGTSPMFTMPVSSVDSGRSNDNYGNWNNPFVYLVWMWAFSMFGGNGLWGNRNGVETAILKACKKLLRKHGFLESDAIRSKHHREEADKEEHTHDPFSADNEEAEDEHRCHAWDKNPMGRLFLLVDELQELAYKGHGPQVIEKRFREACSDDVRDEELKVMGRLVMADGFRKHASALGMTKEAFKKHLASIADKIKRESMDDED